VADSSDLIETEHASPSKIDEEGAGLLKDTHLLGLKDTGTHVSDTKIRQTIEHRISQVVTSITGRSVGQCLCKHKFMY
jgi:hypothetical protein